MMKMMREFQKHNMKKGIRRMVKPVAMFTCEMCGKEVKRAGQFEFRSPQYIVDHSPRMLSVCRTCIYRETFPKKGIMAKKKDMLIENGIIFDGEPYTN